MKPKVAGFAELEKTIIGCNRCPRLRHHCLKVAKEKRRQFVDDNYWGKPVPGFGDPRAEILIVGLAPAAHGGNRTGRMFTGDQSGVWLYRALHRAGLANQAESVSRQDGLKLKGAYVTAINRCAPPENKCLPREIANCAEYLQTELALLKQVKVFICLGQIALRGLWKQLPEEIKMDRTLPKFGHGARLKLKDGRTILCSFHPSQQNTFTKRLTEPMFDSIFEKALELL